MDKRVFYKKLAGLSLPIAFQYLMLALVAVSDALMLGNIEQNQMSAVSLATQIQFLQNMLMSAGISAGSILAAQYWGKKDVKSIREIFNICLRLSSALCIITCVLCETCPEILMSIFTNETALIAIGAKYLRIAGWSYLLTGISQSYMTIMKVSEHTKMAAMIGSLVVIINVFLNAVFIYGLFGAPKLEAEGAAVATLTVRIIEVIICILTGLKKDYISPDLSRIFRRNRLLSKDFIKCMLPLLGTGVLWSIGFSSYSAFMGHLGEDAAAANSVAAVVRDCVCCVCDGLAVGGGILVGNALGAGDLVNGKKYGDKIVVLAYITGFVSTLIMLLLTPAIMHFVRLTAEASSLLKGMMIVMAVYMIGRAVNTVIINGIFGAGGDTAFDMYSLAVSMWGIAVPLAALGTFVLGWHPIVVYACTCLDEVGKIPWTMVHYKKYKWVKDLTRETDTV